jgi:hypothetical protein
VIFGTKVDRKNKERGANLEEVNAQLRKSLEHCRELLAECRTKLAANDDERHAEGPASDENRSQA